jgi:hypothetical protein
MPAWLLTSCGTNTKISAPALVITNELPGCKNTYKPTFLLLMLALHYKTAITSTHTSTDYLTTHCHTRLLYITPPHSPILPITDYYPCNQCCNPIASFRSWLPTFVPHFITVTGLQLFTHKESTNKQDCEISYKPHHTPDEHAIWLAAQYKAANMRPSREVFNNRK